MKRIARSTYRRIFRLPALGLFVLMFIAFATSSPGPSSGAQKHPSSLPILLLGAFLLWMILGRRIALWLMPLFVSRIQCPGCGEDIEAVGVWNCTCGFHDHKERHVLAKVCPKCGSRVGHFDCPQCDTTILLW